MFLDPNLNQECVCGRSFDNAGAFTRHKKTCQEGKKRLAGVLMQAKEVRLRKKRRVKGTSESSTESLDSNSVQVDGMHNDLWLSSYIRSNDRCVSHQWLPLLLVVLVHPKSYGPIRRQLRVTAKYTTQGSMKQYVSNSSFDIRAIQTSEFGDILG